MWLWILATIVAFYIKGLCGFANTLVFTSILGFGENNVNISPVELLVGYPSNMIMTWKNRKELNPKIFLPATIFVLVGSIPGAFILKNVNAQAIKVFFGIVVILIGIDMLLKELGKRKPTKNKVVIFITGMVSGLLCGIFGVGVLVAAFMNGTTNSLSEFKANFSAVFVVENTVRIITYAIIGIITLSTLKQAVYMLPFMLIGLYAGILSAKVLDEKKAKVVVIILLIISGIALIGMNLQ